MRLYRGRAERGGIGNRPSSKGAVTPAYRFGLQRLLDGFAALIDGRD